MSPPAEWTTPEALLAQLQRHWESGRILSAHLTGEPLFPLPLRLRRPDTSALANHYGEVRRWIRVLQEGSREVRGYGYEVEWTEVQHRQLGRNRVPKGATIPSTQDALRMLGREQQAERFSQLASVTLDAFPALRNWMESHPHVVLEQADVWERFLAVLRWFREHPRPGLYLRQLDIPDVDTKFIQAHAGLLSELLEQVLPPEAVDTGAPRGAFELRFGLRAKPPLVRLRLLDSRLFLSGVSDLSVPAAQLGKLSLPLERVFITENEVNGLAFPDVPGSLVIFGLGYALERLTEVDWLASTPLYYWGDIDTHGFAILDRLRATFPHARSWLMDQKTLMAHQPLWVEEASAHPGGLKRLTQAEQALFQELQQDRFGRRVRLEQERVSFGWLRDALAAL